jgi:PD-(D/E)XK nuclease superfamily
VHAAIGENFRQKIETKEDLPASALMALFREAWALLVKGEFPDLFGRPKLPPEFAEDEDPETLRAEGEALTLKYLDEYCPAIQPAAVELPVEGRINGVEVKGFIDLLDTEGRIIDLKVVKRSPSEDKVSPDHRFQVATYRKLLDGMVTGEARVDHLVKNKTPKIVRQEYTIQNCDLEECEKMYPLVQQAIRTGLFLPIVRAICARASIARSGAPASASSAGRWETKVVPWSGPCSLPSAVCTFWNPGAAQPFAVVLRVPFRAARATATLEATRFFETDAEALSRSALTRPQRRRVASMIRRLPAALRRRFFFGAAGEGCPVRPTDCLLASAHLLRWAAAIRVRAARDILRPGRLPPVRDRAGCALLR